MSSQSHSCEPVPGAVPVTREVADILRMHKQEYQQKFPVTPEQRKALEAMVACRTAQLGGHVQWCEHCDYYRIAYNSCRNRHCPKCQALAQGRWLEQRKEVTLPVGHFHVVFTLPQQLRDLVLPNQRRLYGLLFFAATQTLQQFGRDPKYLGAQMGITAVLHTWSRTLAYHPHLHCIVTAGGLSWDQHSWVPSRQQGRYLFPVKALAKVFAGKFVSALRTLYQAGALRLVGSAAAWQTPAAFDVLMQSVASQPWVVYAKRPFGGAQQVYGYLGQYTHRVGLSNKRLREVTAQRVRFSTKGGKDCTVTPLEFIRRLLLHVLPAGFVKIRHYGLLAASNVNSRLVRARSLLLAAAATAALSSSAAAVSAGAPPATAAPAVAAPLVPAHTGGHLPGSAAQAVDSPPQFRCPTCGMDTLRLLPLGAAHRLTMMRILVLTLWAVVLGTDSC